MSYFEIGVLITTGLTAAILADVARELREINRQIRRAGYHMTGQVDHG